VRPPARRGPRGARHHAHPGARRVAARPRGPLGRRPPSRGAGERRGVQHGGLPARRPGGGAGAAGRARWLPAGQPPRRLHHQRACPGPGDRRGRRGPRCGSGRRAGLGRRRRRARGATLDPGGRRHDPGERRRPRVRAAPTCSRAGTCPRSGRTARRGSSQAGRQRRLGVRGPADPERRAERRRGRRPPEEYGMEPTALSSSCGRAATTSTRASTT
jgi:hypothetical protein